MTDVWTVMICGKSQLSRKKMQIQYLYTKDEASYLRWPKEWITHFDQSIYYIGKDKNAYNSYIFLFMKKYVT